MAATAGGLEGGSIKGIETGRVNFSCIAQNIIKGLLQLQHVYPQTLDLDKTNSPKDELKTTTHKTTSLKIKFKFCNVNI